jgi:hypothetical protein
VGGPTSSVLGDALIANDLVMSRPLGNGSLENPDLAAGDLRAFTDRDLTVSL